MKIKEKQKEKKKAFQFQEKALARKKLLCIKNIVCIAL